MPEFWTNIINYLGTGANLIGAFAIWEGWQTYALGKKNDQTQQQDRGQMGMVFGIMLIAGSLIILPYIRNRIAGLG